MRLLPGPSLCSGALQILWHQSWTGLCEGAVDRRGAEVVCRELGCGARPVLQGELSAQPPLGLRFRCEGRESALMDCPHSGPDTPSDSSDSCSSGHSVTVTCSGNTHLQHHPSSLMSRNINLHAIFWSFIHCKNNCLKRRKNDLF